MKARDLLTDAFGRISARVHQAVEGLDEEALTYRVDPAANTIAWLVWHLTRVQDDHVSEVADREQTWIADGWHERFGMRADASDTGYGHTSQEVAAVRPPSADVLLDYHDAVTGRTLTYLETIEANDLDRIVDRSYDPPVSLGVRLVSVVSDNLQHAGQAAYLRGVVERRA